jgi:hypothetical protein
MHGNRPTTPQISVFIHDDVINGRNDRQNAMRKGEGR